MIYFIKSESGHVKIGYTENGVEQRLPTLQCGNPYKLTILRVIEGDRRQESLIHKKFSDKRCQGEWFVLDENISTFIDNPYTIKKPPRAKPKPKPKPKPIPSKPRQKSRVAPTLEATGLSVKEIAKRTGLSYQIVYYHLQGKHTIGAEAARKYNKALGISFESLIE